MANVQKDLGPVSAYALAVKYGFTGTEEEWAALQIAAAENAKIAAEAAEAAAKTLADAEETISAAGNAQVQAVERKGQETLDSIPESYTELSQNVGQLSEEIDELRIYSEAVGKVIVLDDSSSRAITSLTVNGGEETAGVESVEISVYGRNLWSLASGGSSDNWKAFIPEQSFAVKKGVYTLSFDNDSAGSHNITFIGKSGAKYNWRPSAAQKGRISNTFEFLEDISKISWFFNSNAAFAVWDIQLEYGDSVNSYEPYKVVQSMTIATNGTANVVVENPGINTNLPATTIFNNVGAEMSVVYTADQKAYIQKAAANANAVDWIEYGLPILELTGDTLGMSKDDSVTLGYVYRINQYNKTMGTCSVKWQGSSSIGFPKKNYTIKFDSEFEAKAGWGSQKKYCFKANWIDASHLRNLLSAKKWGEIVKSRSVANANLNALVNGGAVDGFPCIININGNFAGLYTFNIPKDGWMFGMGTGTNEAILCADKHVAATQFKGTATLDGDFELEYVTDENDAAWVTTSLNRLITACMQSDGSDLDTTVAQYLDWDSAIDYYIFTCLLKGTDMTDKNYLLSTYDGVKWFFSAYDLDSVYGLKDDGSQFFGADDGVSFYDYATVHRVMNLIYTRKKAALKVRYAELRSGVMSEDSFITTMENFGGSFPEEAYAADRKRWPGLSLTSVNNANQIRDWYRRRVAWLDAEINAL